MHIIEKKWFFYYYIIFEMKYARELGFFGLLYIL